MIFRPIKAICFTLLAAALLFTACQANTELPTATAQVTPAGSTPSPEAVQTSSPLATATLPATEAVPDAALGIRLEELKGQEIHFWHPWQGDLAKRAGEAAEKFTQENEWGIKVKVTPWYGVGGLFDAVTAAQDASDGTIPDVVAATPDQLAFWNGSRAAIADLTPFINDPLVGWKAEEVRDITPIFWSQDQTGAVQTGIPALRNGQVLFYNRTWAEELGYPDPPATPAEFEEQSCAAAQHNNTAKILELYGTGGWLVDTEPLTTLSWLAAYGANPIPETEGAPYSFVSPQAEEALSFLHGLMEKGCAWLGRGLDREEYFASRRALFYSGMLSDLYAQARWQELAKSKDEWEILPFPGADGKGIVYSSGFSYGVMKSDPKRELAGWLFARWLAEPTNAAKLVEAQPSFPVSEAVAVQFADYRDNFPWSQIRPLLPSVRPAPAFASWRQARRLVEDASWQVYHLPADGLPQILPQLEEAIRENQK